MITIKASPMQVIRLGRVGENERLRVAFDVSALLAELPGASFTIINQGPGDAAAYPCPGVTLENCTLYWPITSAELKQTGRGRCELIVTVGDVVAKSVIYSTQILDALDGSGDAPEPWDSWQTEFAGLVADAQAAAAEAEAASEAIRDMSVLALTRDPGTGATVGKFVNPETGALQLWFGIPQGAPGVSPEIYVRNIPGGHRVMILRADGTYLTFDVMDGADYGYGERITSLSGPALANGTVIEAVGVPEYVDDVTRYAAYSISEPGWYVFARIAARAGVTVTAATEITGDAGHIATVGADHVDVAVRFGVTAASQTVTVTWAGGDAETFVFTAPDLAIRNLDYRTTFYIYDIADYATWEYALTADATFAADKKYFTRAGDEYSLAEVTAGEAVPADTYYNHSKLRFEGMTKNVTYRLDEMVDCPIEIALPVIPENGHGAWFEIQLRYNAAFSCTLLPPEGVKIGTATTQSQTAGVNTIDLQYTDAGDVKMWTLLNTHSNIPT